MLELWQWDIWWFINLYYGPQAYEGMISHVELYWFILCMHTEIIQTSYQMASDQLLDLSQLLLPTATIHCCYEMNTNSELQIADVPPHEVFHMKIVTLIDNFFYVLCQKLYLILNYHSNMDKKSNRCYGWNNNDYDLSVTVLSHWWRVFDMIKISRKG